MEASRPRHRYPRASSAVAAGDVFSLRATGCGWGMTRCATVPMPTGTLTKLLRSWSMEVLERHAPMQAASRSGGGVPKMMRDMSVPRRTTE